MDVLPSAKILGDSMTLLRNFSEDINAKRDKGVPLQDESKRLETLPGRHGGNDLSSNVRNPNRAGTRNCYIQRKPEGRSGHLQCSQRRGGIAT